MFRITFSCILLVLFLVSLVEAQKELKSAVERRQEREVYNKKIDDPANNPFNTDGATDRTTPGQIPKGKLLKLQPPPRMVLDTEISEVLDGDTVAIRNAKNQRVVIRLLGIDAPEIDQEFGRQARENLAEKLNGKKVRLAFEPRGLPDEQGRVLASRREQAVAVIEVIRHGANHELFGIPFGSQQDEGRATGTATKLSIVPTIVPTGKEDGEPSVWARPHFRLIYTFGHYNDAAVAQLMSPYLKTVGPTHYAHFLGVRAEWWFY